MRQVCSYRLSDAVREYVAKEARGMRVSQGRWLEWLVEMWRKGEEKRRAAKQ